MSTQSSVADAQLQVSVTADDELSLRFAGRLETATLGQVWEQALASLHDHKNKRVLVDAAGVEYCDSAGASLLVSLEKSLEKRGGSLRIINFPEDYQPILDLIRGKTTSKRRPESESFIGQLGGRCTSLACDMMDLVSYTGELFLAMLAALRRPGDVRWKDAINAAQTTGFDSFPVVVLVTGLLGLVMGFQSANQFHQYGADVFLADFIGISMVRELGPLMTAVVLTARSGSAFAAELGTMKVNEEVDALSTMGIDPLRFLVTPRVIAAVLMTPILTVFANLAGLAGGALVWKYSLGLPFLTYYNRLVEVLSVTDLAGGLIKSFFFGSLVAGVGCLRGMQTQGGAVAVGHSTTRAVVSGIVLIALADSMFAVIFHLLDI